ncbi:MAG: hypothetical protein ACREXV_03115, partial [Polaromonas sp.]
NGLSAAETCRVDRCGLGVSRHGVPLDGGPASTLALRGPENDEKPLYVRQRGLAANPAPSLSFHQLP